MHVPLRRGAAGWLRDAGSLNTSHVIFRVIGVRDSILQTKRPYLIRQSACGSRLPSVMLSNGRANLQQPRLRATGRCGVYVEARPL
jgi:hypothetical protein